LTIADRTMLNQWRFISSRLHVSFVESVVYTDVVTIASASERAIVASPWCGGCVVIETLGGAVCSEWTCSIRNRSVCHAYEASRTAPPASILETNDGQQSHWNINDVEVFEESNQWF
jgi:hypothetical protein